MQDPFERLASHPLAIAGPVTRLFQLAGILDFAGAARHLWQLPYGRIADRQVSRRAYKTDLHKRFLRDWIARTDAVPGRSLEQVWRIREECIAALSSAGRSTPPSGG
jgi:hypothetical protein